MQLADAYTELERDDALRVGLLYAEGRALLRRARPAALGAPDAGREPMWPADRIDPFGLREPRRTKPVVCAVQAGAGRSAWS